MKTNVDSRLVQKAIESSLIGAELFAREMAEAALSSFIADVEKRLFELEQADYSLEEVHAFKTICQHGAESLESEVVQKTSEVDTIELQFCGGAIAGTVMNVNDHWSWRYAARLKTIAISTGKIRRLPWEKFLHSESLPIAGCPQHIHIDESLIFDFENAREFLLKILGEGFVTMETCKNNMKQNQSELRKLDSTFWLEEAFVEHAYDEMIENHLRNCMLQVVPDAREKRILSKCVVAARALSTGPMIMAQKKEP